MKKKFHTNYGFTIIELLLAMTIFVSVMIVATAGFIGINRTFSKGLARKQLSETVQKVTDDITLTINNEGGLGTIQPTNLPSSDYKAVCGTSTCYVYPGFNITDDAGMFKARLNTDGTIDLANKVYVVDDRYKVDLLNVDSVTYGLKRISGIIRSKDIASFDIPETGYPVVGQDVDTQNITCKGSGAATNCALEKFSFIVNTNGGAL